jgi:hypothetical protein
MCAEVAGPDQVEADSPDRADGLVRGLDRSGTDSMKLRFGRTVIRTNLLPVIMGKILFRNCT